jgi:hypothetical protein
MFLPIFILYDHYEAWAGQPTCNGCLCERPRETPGDYEEEHFSTLSLDTDSGKTLWEGHFTGIGMRRFNKHTTAKPDVGPGDAKALCDYPSCRRRRPRSVAAIPSEPADTRCLIQTL